MPKNIYLFSMQTVKIHTSQNIEIDYEVAHLGDRILATLVDGGVMLGVWYVLYFIAILIFASSFKAFENGSGFPTSIVIVLVIYSIVAVFYKLIAEIFFNGQSIGKYAMKIRVISLDGSRPSVGQYLLRWVFRLIDFGISGGLCAFICVAMSKNKQRLGDMVAGTTLIKTQPRTELQDLYFNFTDEDYEPVFTSANNLNDHEVTLIHEVIATFKRTGNSQIVYDMAVKVRTHLGINIPPGMNDFEFLQTLVKDYNYLTSRTEV